MPGIASASLRTENFFGRAVTMAALFCFAWVIAMPASSTHVHAEPMAVETLWLETVSGKHKIDVEVARTAPEKSRGLMFRTSLSPGKGMLFTYEEAADHAMWMRNTYIPLDMVFINADGRVHRIEANTEPFSERVISAGGLVTGVLEIAGGEAARLGLKPGDLVRHGWFQTAENN